MYKEKENKDSYPKKYTREDEIDISVIFSNLRSAANSISHGFKSFLLLIVRKFIFLIAFFCIGSLAGYATYSVTKPYYTSSMTLVLAEIRNQFVEDELSKFTVMVDDDNFNAIADRLEISVEDAKQIKKLTFSNLDQERVSEDSILTGSPFRIELQLYDRKLFEKMEPAITSYLENNRFFAKQKRIKQRQIEGMITKLKKEISSMDSIKAEISAPRGPVNGFVYGEPLDPSNLFRESISMYEQQAELEAELEQLDNMQVVIGFSPQSRPTGPNLLKYLALGGLIAFVIGLLVALRLEAKRKRKLA
ncbi:chain length determinant protein [Pontibacter arcticus]|uniref:Chain length determinant protein n=1 Tax=Pontibacter arcticus TaxID=2080288 RepID=A0A364RFF2_9BACT|nr:chain length determinant protein [Pontibacter arcticus]RAU82997.1 chain length determinant protein [Pontibacter arcticus]